MLIRKYTILVYLLIVSFSPLFGQHQLTLTNEEEKEIKQGETVELFSNSVKAAEKKLAPYLEKGVDVPTPKDLAGGYTHSQHKKNYFLMQKAGVLFQITGDEAYAEFIKNTLEKYSAQYKNWDRHPSKKSYARGKIFWQCLNDANWLVYTSQAYGSIYSWLSPKERKKLNNELFRPMADFLSVETPRFFNRLHNHSTWANAGVGMIGLVMEDEDLVQKALYGLPITDEKVKDNDGGSITKEGQKEAGFLAQIDHSFSPDGYYTEGPYYQRYAMYPFLIFALALENQQPSLEIFKYRDGVLLKAVDALLQQTNASGEFFPLNDAQKGMSYYSRELQLSLALGYYYGKQDKGLLGLIKEQQRVPLNYAGYIVARDINKGLAQPFKKHSIYFSDGPKGDKGGIGVLRSDEVELIMKFSQHGMGHGHFDRLSYSLNFGKEEVLQDYGAARYVNIHQKDGGGYLKENKTWAKQTIAHNTVVVGKRSQFKGNVKKADSISPDEYIFSTDKENVQVVSAKESNAYQGVDLHRTLVLIKDSSFENPLVLDLFNVQLDTAQLLQLPYHYHGQLMFSSVDLQRATTLKPLGEKDGYQHLWNVAEGEVKGAFNQINWFDKHRFYTLNMATTEGESITLAELGANDPHFNLRRDPSIILNKQGQKGDNWMVSILETHGSYSTVTEASKNTYSTIKDVFISFQNNEYITVNFTNKQNEEWTFILSTVDNSDVKEHQLSLKDRVIKWDGPFVLFKNEIDQ
ncbi:alginate lyase family protein [Flammeovirga sp. SubArs3]|uniref:alginate lyase family protein n=1 Tax=Flammeovirga sp. SubArs3 TaxID=2995316 RepID=UPI00248BDE1E|nr:alginate lyase family protein [Flammeovirga sp. SubArs3]